MEYLNSHPKSLRPTANSMSSSASDRVQYARAPYMQQRAHMAMPIDPSSSQQNITNGSIIQSPENPYAYDVVSSNYRWVLESVKIADPDGKINPSLSVAQQQFESQHDSPTASPLTGHGQPSWTSTTKLQHSSPTYTSAAAKWICRPHARYARWAWKFFASSMCAQCCGKMKI